MKRFCLVVFVPVLIAAAALAAIEKKKPGVVLFPRLSKGQVLRYQATVHTTSKNGTTSMVQDSASSASTEFSLSLGIRLEVLEVEAGNGVANTDSVARLRATYERVAATQRSDDPASDDAAAEKRAAQLEGKSFECTMQRGEVRECSGNEEAFPGAAEELRNWLVQIFAAAYLPQKGIVPGESWGDEQEVEGEIPLAGLRWVRQITYVRDEPCQNGTAAARGGHSASPLESGEMCAVIRTRSLLTRKENRKDATPGAFREKGLRTSGSARGVNESLLRISLANGLTVSGAQTGWQTSDFTVSTADGERKIRTTRDFKRDSGLTQVRDAP
jgi:hypothetical protein